jgi:hypothetical protein
MFAGAASPPGRVTTLIVLDLILAALARWVPKTIPAFIGYF